MADPLNPFGNPFAGPGLPGLVDPFKPKAPQAPPLDLPTLTPQEQSTLLGRVGEESLGGLAYLGKLLDKVTLARPLRALAGSVFGGDIPHPSELLSFLPFSDTLGLTSERNTVHGTDLLEQAGLLTPGDDSWENLAAGVGAEIALDPATLFGGAVVKPVLGAYRAGAQGAGRLAGKATELATGGRVNPYTWAGRQAEAGGRAVGALFDPAARGAWSEGGQALAREVFDPTLRQGVAEARRLYAEPTVELAGLTVPGRSEGDLLSALRQRAEGYAPEADARLAGLGLTPDQVAHATSRFDPFAGAVKGTREREAALGAVSHEFSDIPPAVVEARKLAAEAGLPDPYPEWGTVRGTTEYYPRQLAEYPEASFRGRTSRLSGSSEFQKEREDLFRGIAGGTTTLERLTKDAGLVGPGRTMSDLEAKRKVLEEITGNPAVLPSDVMKVQADKLADYLHGLQPGVKDTGLFSSDVIGAGLGRLEATAKVVASEKTLMEGIKRFARPLSEFQARGERFVPVGDLLDAAKFTHADATGTPVARAKAAGLLGLDASAAGGIDQAAKGFGLPEDVARDILRMGEAIKTPAVLAPVVEAWDRSLNFFKTYLTAVFPAFHVRNLMSGLFNTWRDGALTIAGVDQAQKLLRGGSLYPELATKLYPGLPLEQANKEFLKEVIANRVAFTRGSRQASDVVGAAGATADRVLPSQVPAVGGAVRGVGEDVGGFLKELVPAKGKVGEELLNPLNIAGVNKEEDVNRLVKAGRGVGNVTEDFVRLTHYIGKRAAGFDPATATASVMKYQVDYSELSAFERSVMKRVAPWYTFSRRSLPVVLEDLVEKPGKLAGAMRATTNMRPPYEFVPEFVGEGASVAIPGAPEGQQRYITSFGLPFEDELAKTFGSALQGDARRVAQSLFGMAVPWLKVPAEVATGTQMFTGRRLEDLRPYEFMTAGGLVPEDVARQLTQVVANTPLSRAASSVDKLIDERKGLGPTLANLLGGVKVSDVDEERLREVAARDQLKEALRGTPGVRVREDVYVPVAERGQLNPYQLDLLAALKTQEKKVQDQARARQKEAGR